MTCQHTNRYDGEVEDDEAWPEPVVLPKISDVEQAADGVVHHGLQTGIQSLTVEMSGAVGFFMPTR